MTETVYGYRLSRQQSWLWPVRTAGWPATTRCEIAVQGPVDTDRLAAVVDRVLRRHEALRTTFDEVPGLAEPVQRIVDDPADAGVRVRLGDPDGDGTRTLTIEAPALIADAASLADLCGEIAHGYAADAAAATPTEETQYAGYSEWQHELTAAPDEHAEAGAAYWRSRISGVAPASPPYATGAAAGVPAAYARTRVPVDDDLADAVRRHAADLGVGVDAVLLTGWVGLLAVLSGQRRLTVGATVDGRGVPELSGVVGAFARSAPVTVTVPDAGPARELTAEVAGMLAANRAHQHHLPAGAALTADGAPALPVGFSWTPLPEPVDAGGTRFSVRALESTPAPAALTLAVTAGADAGLTVELLHHPEVVPAEAAATLADQFTAALAQVTADGGARPVRRMDLYTARAAAVIDAVNATARGGGPAPSWLRTFAGRAAAAPDAVAVSDATGALSYAELDRRSAALAAHLRGTGVGPDQVVAVCHRPTVGALVAALGIMRAGGTWLPLDPAWPVARLRMIMRDARPVLLVTESELLTAADGVVGDVLCLDQRADLFDPGTTASAAGGAGSSIVDPQNVAYVLYTSGSTGTPKAVAVTHAGLDNYLDWAARAYAMSPATRTLVHSSLSFDLTITSLLAPLTAGGQVRFADPAGLEGLVRGLSETGGPADADAGGMSGTGGTDLLKLTPAHLRLLPQLGTAAAGLAGLRTVVIGGEALTAQTLAPWRELAPQATLVNEYGPTETVVGCCVYRVGPDTPDPHAGRAAVPIGTPIDDTRLLVLDADMRRVGIGVPGELYVAGAGVARGYRNRPDLTADRFPPDPYGAAGDRLYRTGDLVRHLPDGTLEYLGRDDQQVQVNGFRVEPAEVEAVLVRHPDVATAAVVARATTDAHTLVGYVTPAPGARPDPHEVREFLRTRLPSHLVPAAVVVLDELPLTGNGKVDAARLPEPAANQPAANEPTPGQPTPGAGPNTPTEEAIAALWARMLGVEQVGVHENFFDLGGHSFLLVELAAALQAQFGTEVSVLTLLERPTVAGLAAALAGTDAATGSGSGSVTAGTAGAAGPDDPADDAVRRAGLRQQAQQRARERHEATR